MFISIMRFYSLGDVKNFNVFYNDDSMKIFKNNINFEVHIN